MDDLREALSSLSRTVAFHARDWGQHRGDAWLYGVLVGWEDDALPKLAQQHGWSEEYVERLRRYRAAIVKVQSGPD